MSQLLVVTGGAVMAEVVQASLARGGFTPAAVDYEEALESVNRQTPNLALVEIPSRDSETVWGLIGDLKKGRNLPVIALMPDEAPATLLDSHEIDDFVMRPFSDTELLLRINRLLKKAGANEGSELIVCSGLAVDLATCEVTVDGQKVDLTFKEYELLKLMAGNRGRVFTREALLDKIWGYDYYGGDRTVDVHMRRLRSKIEDADHTYIETVRNIGYRFVKE